MENIKKFRGNELALAGAVKEDLTCSGSSPLNKAISPKQSTDRGGRAPTVESYKRQAASNKHRSGSESVRILVNHWRWLETQGPSYKRQATSCKLQAISQVKRQAASD